MWSCSLIFGGFVRNTCEPPTCQKPVPLWRYVVHWRKGFPWWRWEPCQCWMPPAACSAQAAGYSHHTAHKCRGKFHEDEDKFFDLKKINKHSVKKSKYKYHAISSGVAPNSWMYSSQKETCQHKMGEIHRIHYALHQYKLLFQSSSNQSEELKLWWNWGGVSSCKVPLSSKSHSLLQKYFNIILHFFPYTLFSYTHTCIPIQSDLKQNVGHKLNNYTELGSGRRNITTIVGG